MNKYVKSQKFSQLYPNLRKLGRSVGKCTQEASQYSICCTTKGLNVNQYDCQKEFENLMLCVRKEMKSSK